MDAVKKFFAKRGIGYFVSVVALILTVITFVLYLSMGKTSYTEEKLSVKVIVSLVLAMILLAAGLVIELKPLRYVAYLLCFFAIFAYAEIWGNFFGTLMFPDTDTKSIAENIGKFVTPLVFLGISMVFALLSALLSPWIPWAKKENAERNAEAETAEDKKEVAENE